MVSPFLIFCGISIVFSVVAAPVSIPTAALEVSFPPHLFINRFLSLAFLMIAILVG